LAYSYQIKSLIGWGEPRANLNVSTANCGANATAQGGLAKTIMQGMNGILIVAHAPLAHALRECALHVFADAGDCVAALDVRSDATPEQTLAAAKAAFDRLPRSSGVLVLADLFGATPCNVARRLAEDRPCRLVAGVNLPMLLRALTYRHEPLEELVQRALAGGSQGVVNVDPAQPCPSLCAGPSQA